MLRARHSEDRSSPRLPALQLALAGLAFLATAIPVLAHEPKKAGPATEKTPPATIGIDPEHPQRFVYDGEDLYLAGYYLGLPPLTARKFVDRRHYRTLIDEMAEHGINLLRVVMTFTTALESDGSPGTSEWLLPYERSGKCCTAHAETLCGKKTCPADDGVHDPDPNPEFCRTQGRRYDLNRFHEPFFDYWDELVAYALSRRVVVQMAILDGYHTREWCWSAPPGATLNSPTGQLFDLFIGRNNANRVHAPKSELWYHSPKIVERQLALVEKAVARLCRHPNLIWETANEPQLRWSETPLPHFGGRTWQRVIADRIREVEARDEACPRHLVIPFDLPEHRTVAGDRIPGDPASDEDWERVHREMVAQFYELERPLLADNDCCYDPGTAEERRRKAWVALVSGAYPNLLHNRPDLDHDHPEVQKGLREVGYTRVLLDARDIDLRGMVPKDDVVETRDRVWALARPGERYLLYYYRGGTARLKAPPEDLRAEWFDPRTGRFRDAGAGPVFTAPSEEDWVLVVFSKDE